MSEIGTHFYKTNKYKMDTTYIQNNTLCCCSVVASYPVLHICYFTISYYTNPLDPPPTAAPSFTLLLLLLLYHHYH